MRIKLAILEHDEEYLGRISSVLMSKYYGKVEVFCFTEPEQALKAVKENKMNVFLVAEDYELNQMDLPGSCSGAYLVEFMNVETYKGFPAIGKYQKAEMIYRRALDILSESISDSMEIKGSSHTPGRVITFVSASGGTGCSSVAVACAKGHHLQGRRVLFLNLEQMGDTELFFHDSEQVGLSEVIFALKRKKGNLTLKLESSVSKDASGVNFFRSAKTPLDVAEMNPEDIECLINALRNSSDYEVIIVDINFSLSANVMEVLNQSEKIVFVSTGSEVANSKLQKACEALETMEAHQGGSPILAKTSIFYNMFSSRWGKMLDNQIHVMGGCPRVQGGLAEQVMEELMKSDVLSEI